MNAVCAGSQIVMITAIPTGLILVPNTYHANTKETNMMIPQPSPTVKAEAHATVTSIKDHSSHEGVG